MDMSSLQYEFFRPLATGWMGKIESAERYRSKWMDIANECKMFYSRSAAAMSDSSLTRKFWKGIPTPRFRMTLNKAFEFVALVGPNLMWDSPHRNVEPKKPLEIPPEIFGNQQDPQAQQMYQQAMQEHGMEMAQDKAIASLLSAWLNYTPREIPGGGLTGQSELAVLDAMITGRGCLWVAPYKMPEGRTTLTGAFRAPPEHLYVDPDFHHINEAKWIAKKTIDATWNVERKFKLPKGSLKKAATLESASSQASRIGDDSRNTERSIGGTNDLMVYFEIYSKTGCGVRLSGMDVAVSQHLEKVVGDYAYIVIAPNVPYPLNCSTELLRSGATDDVVKQAFSWPVQTWRDQAWPVVLLDFYQDTDCSWPIAPLAPGMGQLKFLNTMFSHVCNRIWSSSRDFIAVAKAAFSDLEKYFKEGEDQVLIPIADATGPITNSVNFLQQPQTNLDVWRIIEAVSESFDKAVGLTPVLYAMNPNDTQSRSAEETKAKTSAAGVRPQYMAKKVVEWQCGVAAQEAFCARLFITGNDVMPLLGRTGAMLWDRLVQSADMEKVMRQMSYTIAAASIRRPDRDRDVANIQQALQQFLPIVGQHAATTGETEPINFLTRKWGEVVDMDMAGLQLGQQLPPPPPPEAQQQMQAEQQMEMAKLNADVQKVQMSAQAAQQQAQLDAQAKVQDVQMKREMAQFDLMAKREEMSLDAESKRQEMAFDMQGKQQEMKFDSISRLLDLQFDERRATQDLNQSQQAGKQKLTEAKRMGDTQITLAKKQAAMKPKPKPSQTNGARK